MLLDNCSNIKLTIYFIVNRMPNYSHSYDASWSLIVRVIWNEIVLKNSLSQILLDRRFAYSSFKLLTFFVLQYRHVTSSAFSDCVRSSSLFEELFSMRIYFHLLFLVPLHVNFIFLISFNISLKVTDFFIHFVHIAFNSIETTRGEGR